MAIDETKPVTPASHAGYDDLFDLKDRVEEMHHRDIETIIHEVCAKDRDGQFRRKLIVIETRDLSQSEHDQTNNAKVANYRALYGVYLDGALVICHVGAALAGAQTSMLGGLFQVAAQAFDKTSGYRQKISQSEIEVFTHRYQRIGSNINDQSQQIQSAEREHEQMAAMIDRLMQTTQRTFELMASSSS
jgi:hypothetical protein